jgi:alkylhydroperoxidase family enzyme
MTDAKMSAAAAQPAGWDAGDMAFFPAVDPDTSHPILAPIFDALKRAGHGPLNIHRVIANAPEFYAGFARFAAVLRGPGETSRADRELAILRTVQCLGAGYEYIQHRRIGLSVGLQEAQIDALSDWRSSDAFDPRQRLILELIDAILRKETVEPSVWTRLRAHFSPGEIVELTLVTGFYTAVAQLTHTLPIRPEERVTSYGE